MGLLIRIYFDIGGAQLLFMYDLIIFFHKRSLAKGAYCNVLNASMELLLTWQVRITG